MDTTKNSREEAKRRPRQEAPQQPRKRPAEAQPARKRPQEARQPSAEGQKKASRPEGEKKAPQRQAQSTQHREQPKARTAQKSAAQQPRKSRREQPDDLSSKKRAYGNSKPKKKSTVAVMSSAIAATARESAEKRRKKQEAQGKKTRPQQPTPAVIYTQPQPFNRSRLMIQLITVTAMVVAFVVGMSVFFKVGKVTVSGMEVYTDWNVKEASGIKEGDNLLTFSRARAGALIKANLPYVKNVSFGIKLPDTVNIIIEEEDVVYAIKDQDEGWWLMNSNGHVVTQGNNNTAKNYTQVLGVAIDHPVPDQTAVAVEVASAAQDPSDPTDPTAETQVQAVTTVSGAQRLETALQILQALEENDIVGDAASINVAQPQSLTLWYGTRYQVNLGDTSNLDYKIATMNDVILQLSDYQSGILDLSFTIWPDQVGYTPFS